MTLDLLVPLVRDGGFGGGWSVYYRAWCFECMYQREDGATPAVRLMVPVDVPDGQFFAMLADMIGRVLSYRNPIA